MVEDTNINIDVKTKDASLRKLIKLVDSLTKKLNSTTATNRKLAQSVRSLEGRFNTATRKLKDMNAALRSAEGRLDRQRAALRRLTKGLKDTGVEADKTRKKLGFTGLAFAFIGGSAGYALSRLQGFFRGIVTDGVASLDKMSDAIILTSDRLDTLEGKKAGKALQAQMLKWGNEFPVQLNDIFDATTQVGKATGSMNAAMALTPEVLRMMTIEQVDAKEAAKALVVGMTNYGDQIKDNSKLSKMFIATSLSTRASLDDVTRSFGFMSADAKAAGASAAESLALIGVVVQGLGTNAGSAGRNLRIMTRTLTNLQTTGKTLNKLGIDVLDGNKMRNIVDIIGDIRKQYQSLLATNPAKAEAFLQALKLPTEGQTALRIILNVDESKFKSIVEDIDQMKQVEERTAAMKQKLGSQFAFMMNSINTLKLSFVSGLLPAMTQLTEVFKTFAQDQEFILLMEDLGKAIGNELLPLIKGALGAFKTFMQIMKANPALLTLFAKGLIGIGIGLALIAAVAPAIGGVFATLFILEKFPGITGKATKGINAFGKALKTMISGSQGGGFISGSKGLAARLSSGFARAGLKAGAFFSVAFNFASSKLAGAGKWVLRALIKMGRLFIAGGLAIGAVFGEAFNLSSERIIGLGAWIKRVLIRIGAALGIGGAISGGAFGGAFTAMSEAIMAAGGWIKGVLVKLGTYLALGGLGIGQAFGSAFGSGSALGSRIAGMFSAARGASTAAATASGLMTIGAFAAAFLAGLYGTQLILEQVFPESTKEARRKIKEFWGLEGDWAFLGQPFWNLYEVFNFHIIPEMQKGFGNMVNTIIDGLNGLIEIANRLGGSFKPIGKISVAQGATDADYKAWLEGKRGPSMEEFMKGKTQTKESTNINSDALPSSTTQAYIEKMKEQVDAASKDLDKVNEKVEVLSEHNKQISDAISVTQIQNSQTSVNTKTLQKLTEFLNKGTIEVAKNINITSAMTTLIANVNVMWARLIAEGNRAAGKLASLSVSKSGVFSIRDPGISAADQAEINAQAAIAAQTKANQTVIDIQALTRELARANNPSPLPTTGGGTAGSGASITSKGGNKFDINITPTINVPQGSNVNTKDLAKQISDQIAEELTKKLGSLIS